MFNDPRVGACMGSYDTLSGGLRRAPGVGRGDREGNDGRCLEEGALTQGGVVTKAFLEEAETLARVCRRLRIRRRKDIPGGRLGPSWAQRLGRELRVSPGQWGGLPAARRGRPYTVPTP